MPRLRVISRTQEYEEEFEVCNAIAALPANTRVCSFDNTLRELVGPATTAGPYRFEFRLTCAMERQRLKRDHDIGLGVCRTDTTPGSVFARWEMVVLNQDRRKSQTFCDPNYTEFRAGGQQGRRSRSFPEGTVCGWWGHLDAPDSMGTGLKIMNLLEPSEGWLHQGSLRMICRISIVMGSEREAAAAEAVVVEEETQSSSQKEVCDCLRKLLDSANLADVTLTVGDERISVHSQILAARSPFFSAMLSAGMREAHERVVDLPDLEAAAVRELLAFFYTGEVQQQTLEDDESTLALLQAAHRVDAGTLVRRCTEALSARFTAENVSERLELAEFIGCSAFKEQCLNWMRRQMSAVQMTASFDQLAERRPALLRDVLAAVVGPPAKRARRSVPAPSTAQQPWLEGSGGGAAAQPSQAPP